MGEHEAGHKRAAVNTCPLNFGPHGLMMEFGSFKVAKKVVCAEL